MGDNVKDKRKRMEPSRRLSPSPLLPISMSSPLGGEVSRLANQTDNILKHVVDHGDDRVVVGGGGGAQRDLWVHAV